MKRLFTLLVVVLGTALTTYGQFTIDSIDVTKYDTNYTKVVNYVGDSIIVNTKNQESVEVLMNTYGMVNVQIDKFGAFKFVFRPTVEPRIVTNLTGIPYFIHRVVLNK
jgi:hypothetical protein